MFIIAYFILYSFLRSGARDALPPSAGFTARCKLPQSTGSCHNSIRSYYYDVETQSCKLFFYSGCFGNANRFNSREDCENLCKKPLESEGNSAANETVNQPNKPQVHELAESDNNSPSGAPALEPESAHKGWLVLHVIYLKTPHTWLLALFRMKITTITCSLLIYALKEHKNKAFRFCYGYYQFAGYYSVTL